MSGSAAQDTRLHATCKSRRSPGGRACDRCLARPWLLARLSAHLDPVRGEIAAVLGLDGEELMAAVGGSRRKDVQRQLARFDPEAARRSTAAAGLDQICRCDPAYPARLAELQSAPAVLHVAGGLERFLELAAADPVAVVGARQASAYGAEVARSLGRGIASAGVTVVSGMANGIDSAAHTGALSIDGPTIAVLPGPADAPYPRSQRGLYRRLVAVAAAVSELPAGLAVRRWMFPARNRIIAALTAMTVVVEAGARSGALLTAAFARELGRPIGAVPGRITASQAAGPNDLLAGGACLVRGPQEVLDAAFGVRAPCAASDRRPELDDQQRALLLAIADGHDTPGALVRAGVTPERSLAVLASLELAGYVSRGPGGRFTPLP